MIKKVIPVVLALMISLPVMTVASPAKTTAQPAIIVDDFNISDIITLVSELKSKAFQTFLQLGLTMEQINEIKTLFLTTLRENESQIREVIDAALELNSAIHAEVFNEQLVRNAYQALAAVGEEMAVIKAKGYQKFRTILKPEQLQLIMDFKSDVIDTMLEIFERLVSSD